MPRRAITVPATLAICAAITACAPKQPAAPDIQTREVEYRQGETALRGFLAWDAAREGPRPGVLVVHEWWGHNEHARNQARRLAQAGYVAFALDMYGDGKVTTHPDTAQAFVNEVLSDLPTMNARFVAAREELARDPHVNPDDMAAIGYCFGGAVVLGQARAGADLDAVVSFHGALMPGPVDSGAVRARVLVLTGAADPLVPAEAVENFRQEMSAAGARFDIVSYPGARHSFTNPGADSTVMPALAYDAQADTASWNAMLALFGEVFP